MDAKKVGIIIAGSRNFGDFFVMSRFTMLAISDLIRKGIIEDEYDLSNVTIIQGGADGADTLGYKFALRYRIEQKQFDANWDKFGKSAGYKRNVQMADYASEFDYKVLIAFPEIDGESKGTHMMIDIAKSEKYNFDKIYIKYVNTIPFL